MFDPYIIALDLDGTLLNSKKQILPKTKDILKKLSKQGHIIILASGRPFKNIKNYYDELELSTPVVCYSGSLVFSPMNNTFPPFKSFLDKITITELTNYFLLNGAIDNALCDGEKISYVLKADEEVKTFLHIDVDLVEFGNFDSILKENPYSVLFYSKKHEHNDLIIEKIKTFPDLKPILWWNGLFVELAKQNVNKKEALIYIANHYKIPLDRVITFGDGPNDIDMLSSPFYGILMKNGDFDLSSVAKKISEFSNDEEGIYFELNRLFQVD